jgi:allophanate hydrolase subunit 2
LDEHFSSSRRFRVGAQSDRMGLHLEGELLQVAPAPERLSAPVAPGAIQVAGGRLIVLGVACPTMGGYPHIAHVISADLDRVGQLKGGDPVSFLLVTLDEARSLDREARSQRRIMARRLRLLAADVSMPSSSQLSRLSLPDRET